MHRVSTTGTFHSASNSVASRHASAVSATRSKRSPWTPSGLFGSWQRPKRRASMIARRGRSSQRHKGLERGGQPASRRGAAGERRGKVSFDEREVAGFRAACKGRAALLVGHQPAIEMARASPVMVVAASRTAK